MWGGIGGHIYRISKKNQPIIPSARARTLPLHLWSCDDVLALGLRSFDDDLALGLRSFDDDLALGLRLSRSASSQQTSLTTFSPEERWLFLKLP